MKLAEAIRRIDEIKHNTFSEGEKIQWLSDLDSDIKKRILDTHEGAQKEEFRGYTEEDMTDGVGPELLVPAPWDAMYIYWLEAQIDYYNGEYTRYNNAAARYNERYQDFANYYTRTHMPIGTVTGFFQGGPV